MIKALSGYGIKISLNSIEILNKPNGKPHVKLLDKNLEEFDIKISLSQTTGESSTFIKTQ